MTEFIEEIKNLILNQVKPSHLTTSKKEISVRCPYCGDSKSNQSATHLYIEMKPPFRFHCFKCETSGVLNNNTFRDLGVYDSNAAINVINANKENIKNSGIQKTTFKKKTLKNNVYDTISTANSLLYFNKRYGTNFSADFVSKKFKCILDPIEFFKENNIYVQSGMYDFSNSIGFISTDASHIIFRDISGRQAKRYFNLNLFRDEDVTSISKSYNISVNLSATAPKVKLIITEGIFDIIGVYSHFYQGQNEENIIFAAACGKAFNAVILSYIRMGFLNLDIEIYSDGDVNIEFYTTLKKNSPYLKNQPITIFYNNLYDPKTKFGKDYGVEKNQIQLKKIII